MKLLFLLLTSIYGFSQNNNYIANYEFIRTKGQFVFYADGLLKIGNNTSKFELSQYKNLLKDKEKQYDNKLNDTITVLGSNRICLDKKIYYHNFKKDSTYSILYNKYCRSKVIINDILIYPDWKIENNFKKIGEYNAQKATAFIYDRTWTVYFTNELRINGGPWRLIGLPGLVLEATENTSTYQFKLTKIKKNDEFNEIYKPIHNKESTFKEFVKKAIKRQTDEMYYRLSSFGDTTFEIDKNDFPPYETLDFIEKRN